MVCLFQSNCKDKWTKRDVNYILMIKQKYGMGEVETAEDWGGGAPDSVAEGNRYTLAKGCCWTLKPYQQL